jgi:hypothetical protein
MAMNLRLSAELESSLRERSASTGRSQQDLMRDALREYLRRDILRGLPPQGGIDVPPPSSPYRKTDYRLSLPAGVSSSLELIDRSDRFVD